ncbi:hypothetical protein HWI79_2460 [Cryptosporidium felis]|nr:hypothetical protein HWI79_2460 [Cryptosporidium felis]
MKRWLPHLATISSAFKDLILRNEDGRISLERASSRLEHPGKSGFKSKIKPFDKFGITISSILTLLILQITSNSLLKIPFGVSSKKFSSLSLSSLQILNKRFNGIPQTLGKKLWSFSKFKFLLIYASSSGFSVLWKSEQSRINIHLL